MKMIIQAMNSIGYYKFLVEGNLNRGVAAVSSDSFETIHAHVEKYLSDSPALSVTIEVYASYLTENKGTINQIIKRVFQSI